MNSSYGREHVAWIAMMESQKLSAAETLHSAKVDVTHLLDLAPENSWAKTKAPEYLRLLNSCLPGEAMSAVEYRGMLSTAHERYWDDSYGQYVLCSARDARRLIDDFGPPRIPIMVPPEWNVQDPWRVDDDCDRFQRFFTWVRALEQPMDVNKPFDVASAEEVQLPVKMLPHEIEALFKRESFDTGIGPINLLEIRASQDNPIPACLAELNDLKLMRDLKSLPDATNPDQYAPGKPKAADLATTFQICGQKGVFSEPHIDHHGVITTITVQAGEKMWPVYSQNGAKGLKNWLDEAYKDGPPDHAYSCDRGRWAALFMRAGTLLIQPPGTLHAPYSPKNVLCSGSMHIDTRGLVKSAELSALELQYPEVTNEEPSREYANCMVHAVFMWKKGTQGFRWLSYDDRRKFVELLVTYLEGVAPPASTCCTKPKRAAHASNCKIPKLKKLVIAERKALEKLN